MSWNDPPRDPYDDGGSTDWGEYGGRGPGDPGNPGDTDGLGSRWADETAEEDIWPRHPPGADSDSEFDWGEGELQRWPLDWRGLLPRERWIWFERLWSDVCALRDRYRLPVRSRWWDDAIQVEALAALAAWTARYDSGEWDDPPGKLSLLFELERLHGLLRDGNDPFHPERDRHAFARHLLDIGCSPPPGLAA